MHGDTFMLGRSEMEPLETFGITLGFVKDMVVEPNALRYTLLKNKPEENLKKELHSIQWKEQSLLPFIQKTHKYWNSLRKEIDVLSKECLELIEHHENDEKCFLIPQRINYVGFLVKSEDKKNIIDWARQHVNYIPNLVEYCHHITQVFLGGKKKPSLALCLPHSRVMAVLDALYVRKDGLTAFRVKKLEQNSKKVTTENVAHMTCFVPEGKKPSDSKSLFYESDDEIKKIECDFVLELKCMYF
jgi:hypothetical protein